MQLCGVLGFWEGRLWCASPWAGALNGGSMETECPGVQPEIPCTWLCKKQLRLSPEAATELTLNSVSPWRSRKLLSLLIWRVENISLPPHYLIVLLRLCSILIKKLGSSLFHAWKRSTTYGGDRLVCKYECFYIKVKKQWGCFAKSMGEVLVRSWGTHG